jgi:CRISPR-associated protein Cmr4
MKTRPFLLQALTPLHAGTGHSVGVVDLPLARQRATGIPFLPGSSLKGVLREQLRAPGQEQHTAAIFGPERDRTKRGAEGDDAQALDHSGALVVGDARLLALPVRAFFGTFALVTSPLLLMLARRDLEGGAAGSLPEPLALASEARRAWHGTQPLNVHAGQVYLEELDLPADSSQASRVDDWARALLGGLPEQEERELLARRLLVVDDETMSFLWETATQVDTRVAIHEERGTVAQGQLWTEESLPAETLLVGMLAATDSLRTGVALKAEQVLDTVEAKVRGRTLQLGGKATVGRGRCRMLAMGKAGGAK